MRASRRLYAGGRSCLRDLWHAWRIRDCRSANVRRISGGRGLCGGPGKRVGGVFPGRPQSFRHQRRPVDDCSPGLWGMAQNGGSRGGTFHGEMDRCRETQGRTTACSGMPELDGKNQGRPQSFRHQRRPVDDCSPGLWGMAQNGGSRGGTFYGEMDRCRETQGRTTACNGMPELDGKNQGERIAQSKRARAGLLALVV